VSPPTIKPASVIQNKKYNETDFTGTVLIKSVANTNTYISGHSFLLNLKHNVIYIHVADLD